MSGDFATIVAARRVRLVAVPDAFGLRSAMVGSGRGDAADMAGRLTDSGSGFAAPGVTISAAAVAKLAALRVMVSAVSVEPTNAIPGHIASAMPATP